MELKELKAYIAAFFEGQQKSYPDDLSVLEAPDTVELTIRHGSGLKATQLTIDAGIDVKGDLEKVSAWLKKEFK